MVRARKFNSQKKFHVIKWNKKYIKKICGNCHGVVREQEKRNKALIVQRLFYVCRAEEP